MCRQVFFVHMREKESEKGILKNLIAEFPSLFLVLMFMFLSGPQQPPGGFGAAPGLSGGQEDQGTECRHQVDVLIGSSIGSY